MKFARHLPEEGWLPVVLADLWPGARVDPGLAEAQFSLARVMILRGRPEEAIAHARRAVEFRPEWGAAREMLDNLLGLRD